MSTQTQDTGLAKAQKDVLAILMELGGQLTTDEGWERSQKPMLPVNMSYTQLAEAAIEMARREQETIEGMVEFPYRYYDGLVATDAVVRAILGQAKAIGQASFFGRTPPRYIDVPVSTTESVHVPIGEFEVQAIPSCTLNLQGVMDPEQGEMFRIYYTVRRENEPAVIGLCNEIRKWLKANSIYKGKAIDGGFNFLDLSKVDRDKVVYAQDVLKHMDAHVNVPIKYGNVLNKARVELKHTLLLEGTYGVGKTLFGAVTAQVAEEHGVGFIQVRANQDSLEATLREAKKLSPCVVFVEDIDTMAGPEGDLQHMLEMFDGARAKGSEILVILTTNHADRIHKGMIRPGRIDAVITLTAPDGPGIVRLCKAQIPAELLSVEDTDSDWEQVGIAAEGYIPAFVTEGCKRAIKYSIARMTEGGWTGDSDFSVEDLHGQITALDVAAAMEGLRPQWTMMQDASELVIKHNLDALVSERVEAAAVEAVKATINPQFLNPDEG